MDHSSLDVRRMTEAEYPVAARLMERSISRLMPSHYPPDTLRWLIHHNQPDGIRARSVKQEDYLAWRGANAVGYLGIKRSEIGHLFVDPDAAGQGVGAFLVRFAEDLFRQRGHKTSLVLASLNAAAFYERMGFQRTGDGSLDLAPGVRLPYVRMEKTLAVPV